MEKIVLVLLVMSAPLISQADDNEFYFSGLLGVGTLDLKGTSGDNYENELAYGARLGFLIKNNFSAGLQIQHMQTRSGAGPETSVSSFLGEFTYYLSGSSENSFYVSGLLGITQIEEEPTYYFRGGNGAGITYGANLGYQFMINDRLSLAPQVTYKYTSGAVGGVDASDVSTLLNATWRF
jgi:hypothetical protein